GTLGQQTELQGAADTDQLQLAKTLTQTVEQMLLRRAGMATTGHYGKALRKLMSHLQRPHAALSVGQPGAEFGPPGIATAIGRNADHAKHHPALFDQRDIDRELCTAGDESSRDRKSTGLNSSHVKISYAVLCLK